MFNNNVVAALIGLVTILVGGCLQAPAGGPGGSSEIWSDSTEVPLLNTFQGEWRFDLERTLAAWKSEGAQDEMINRSRAASKKYGELHADITISGHIVRCADLLGSEYRLFTLHEHDGKVCGKAWHHEVPSDYGDMSKCYVTLSLVKDDLHLRVRMQDGLPALNDADLTGSPPITAESGSKCDVDNPSGADWLEWTTYVFVRPAKK